MGGLKVLSTVDRGNVSGELLSYTTGKFKFTVKLVLPYNLNLLYYYSNFTVKYSHLLPIRYLGR